MIWVALALASDVGEVAPLGVGLQLGYPTDISVKYFVNDKAGPSFHLGTSLVWLGFHSRLQWEGQFANLADGSAASFDLYAVGGLTLNVLFGDDTKVRPGVLGGIGGDQQAGAKALDFAGNRHAGHDGVLEAGIGKAQTAAPGDAEDAGGGFGLVELELEAGVSTGFAGSEVEKGDTVAGGGQLGDGAATENLRVARVGQQHGHIDLGNVIEIMTCKSHRQRYSCLVRQRGRRGIH